MLTPAEASGLRGKQIDMRLRRASARLTPARLREFAERLRADAWRNHVIYERDGVAEPVRIMLRPLAATPEQIAYTHHVCSVLNDALRRLADLYLADPDVRRVLALDATEAAWLSQLWSERHGRNNPIYGRLDAVCDFSSATWRDGLAFLEPNLSGIGGIYYAPVVEQLVMRDVVADMRDHDPQLRLDLPRDQRELFMQALLDHAESIGRRLGTLAFIEPKYEHSGPDEQRVLAEFIQDKYGVAVVHVDPRELTLEGGEVCALGRAIDLAYRDYEVRDLIALERDAGADMRPIRRLFADNRVVSSIAGDFDHKSGFELLTNPELAERHFSPEERRLFAKHVLWTRVLAPRQTLTWDGSRVDLAQFALDAREALVLKPNRSFGGTGVHIGATVEPAAWAALVAEALRGADDPHGQWVLQRAAPIPLFEFPLVENGEVVEEPFYAVMGFAPTDHGLGIMCRVSQKQVVNVAQRGGIAAVLIAHDTDAVRGERRGHAQTSGARETLREKLATLRDLDWTIGLLGWDEETHLPAHGHAERGAQLATLESLRHRLLLDPELYDVAMEVAAAGHDALVAREVERFVRLRRIAAALPDSLVKAFARARSTALAAWEAARAARDFEQFREPFAEIVALARERGQALSPRGDAWEGLLDEHEPGLTRAELEPLLRTLAGELAPLIDHTSGTTRGRDAVLRGRRFVEPAQIGLAHTVLARMGFDFRRGRVDRSSHPFTLAAGLHDVRVTLRADPHDFRVALFATLHEGGHALYDQGFDPALADTPLLADAPSVAWHESQARFWENHIGRSRAFWEAFAPVVQRALAPALDDLDAQALHRVVNVVAPGPNRVAADELSYNLHIVLRSELELALLGGHLDVADLPGEWNDRARRYFGIMPGNDTDGCMQDVHWALGSFAYFPSYALGNLYAAMLWDRLVRDLPNIEFAITRGDLSPVTAWLRANVHARGARANAADTLRDITGEALSAASFLDYAKRKFASR
jgi:carboxypeptidase Taq